MNYAILVLSFFLSAIAIMRGYDKAAKKKKILDWVAVLVLLIALGLSVKSQINSDVQKNSANRTIDSLLSENVDVKRKLTGSTDSLQKNIDQLQAAMIFAQSANYNTNLSNDGSKEDMCYLTIVPKSNGTYTFAINNPFPFSMMDISFTVSGYMFVRAIRSQKNEKHIEYSMKDAQRSVIFSKSNITLKPGVTIFSEDIIRNPISLSGRNVFFESTFMGKKYWYVEQLLAALSDDNINASNSFKIYKMWYDRDKGFVYGTVVKQKNVEQFGDKWNKYFDIPVFRLYGDF
jgi:hypothetical protein